MTGTITIRRPRVRGLEPRFESRLLPLGEAALLSALSIAGLRDGRKVVLPVESGYREQRCWNHRLENVLDTLPKKLQAEAREPLTTLP
jgi:hypothetical protein